MYKDQKKGSRYLLYLSILITLLFLAYVIRKHGKSDEEALASIERSIRDCALQCYVVEGVYPPSLSYLEEHYGLTLNKEDYYIHYDIFAENLPPEVRITRRNR